MKRILFRLMPLGIAMCYVGTANASYFQGFVTSIQTAGGIALVQVSNGSGGQLACGEPATGPAVFWFDPTTPLGQSNMALAIAAKATGTQVWIQGNGTCGTTWPETNSEQLTSLSWSG